MIKRSVVLILIFLVLPLISAVEFDMKTDFAQGETLMAKISGNFLDQIMKENIFLYRGHVRVPVDAYVTRINDDYCIYAQLLGKSPSNYSLSIENVKYMKVGQINEEPIVKNFSINETIADFLIEPGFIKTGGDFFIEAQNIQDYKITIEVEITNESSEKNGGFFDFLFKGNQENQSNLVTLKSGEIKKIYFKANEVSGAEIIRFSTENLTYEIPISVTLPETVQEEGNLRFEPLELNVSMSTNSKTTRIIYLYNIGDEPFWNISISVSETLKPYISLSTETVNELKRNANARIELYINSSNTEKSLEGQIIAEDQNISAYTFLSLNFLKDFKPSNESQEPLTTSKTCSELRGKICGENKTCEKDPLVNITGNLTVYAKNGVCCLGICKGKTEKSSVGKIVGWVIVIVIAVFLIWFFGKKYRGAKRPFNLLKIAQRKKK